MQDYIHIHGGANMSTDINRSENNTDKKERLLNWRSFGVSCLIISFGSALLLFNVTDEAICKYMSIVLVLAGIVYVTSYFCRNIGEVFHENDLTFGLLGIITGCVIYFRRDELSVLVHTMVGLILIINALFKLQHAIDMKRMDIKLKQVKQMWLVVIVFSLVVLSSGLVIVLFIEEKPVLFRYLSGCILVFAGVTDIITQIGFVRKLKTFRSVVNVQAGVDFLEQNVRNIAETKSQNVKTEQSKENPEKKEIEKNNDNMSTDSVSNEDTESAENINDRNQVTEDNISSDAEQ